MIVKNVLKGIKNKPFRMMGIILLIAFAGMLYVSLGYVIKSADFSVNEFAKEYNQEDFSFELNSYLSDAELSEVIHNYSSDIQYMYQLNDEDRVKIIDKRLMFLETTYDINIEARSYKQTSYHSTELNKDITIRVFTNNVEINKTYIEKGRLPLNDNEIALNKTFAKSSNLSIDDTIKINDHVFKIVGYIYLVDYTYPQLSSESLVFDSNKQIVAVLSNQSFEDFKAPMVTYYAGEFNKDSYIKSDIDKMNHFYMQKVIDAKQALRTGAIYSEIEADQTMIEALSGVILFLAVVIIGIIVNKSLNNERSQMGVIKSLGYSNSDILKAYMVYPFIASMAGVILGYIGGYFLSIPIFNFFTLYYQMPLTVIAFDWTIIVNSLILPVILVNIFSAIVIYFIVKKPPLDLIRIKSKNKISWFVRVINRLLKHLSFKTRFKYSIAMRGIGKLLITFTGVIIASIYLVFALSSMQSFDTVLNKSIGNGDYKYQIIYEQPTNKEASTSDDKFMMLPANIVKNDEPIDVNLIGIENDLQRYKIVNEANENLVSKIYQNQHNIVITSMLSMINNIDVGDTVKIKITTKQGEPVFHEVKVVGINENYTTSTIYMQLNTLNSYYGLNDSWYNGIWTKTKITDGVESIYDKDEMALTMESLLGMAKLLIYTMVGISIILAIIVLILIAVFNIEDNFKTISFLKVMGYTDQEISHMVINIYLPLVVFAYFISIPVTLLTFRSLIKTMSDQLNFIIPFKMGIIQVLIGLIIIVSTYYLSILFSKRKLNKISLQASLKYNE